MVGSIPGIIKRTGYDRFDWRSGGIKGKGNEFNERTLWLPVLGVVAMLLGFPLVLRPGIVFHP